MKTPIQKTILLFVSGIIAGVNSAEAQCAQSDSYGSSTGWTLVQTVASCSGTAVSIGSGTFNFNGSNGGVENRMYRSLTTLSNTSWVADFDFTLTSNALNIPGHNIAAFTAGTSDPYVNVVTPCNGGSFTSTNQDAIVAQFISTGASSNPANWFISGCSKDGSTWNTASAGINVGTAALYHIRLQRLTATNGLISVFDASWNHVLGSPQCFPINSTVTGLNTLQHGVIPQGGQSRRLWGTIDTMCMSNQTPGISGNANVCCAPGSVLTQTYTVASVPGATAYNWGFPPSPIVISSSNPTPTTLVVTYNCGYMAPASPVTITCAPVFGASTTCMTYSFNVSHNVMLCRLMQPGSENHKSYNLYPNPNNGNFSFDYNVPPESEAVLEIYDATGRKLESLNLPEGEGVLGISLEKMPSGIYFYEVLLNGTIIKRQKFNISK